MKSIVSGSLVDLCHKDVLLDSFSANGNTLLGKKPTMHINTHDYQHSGSYWHGVWDTMRCSYITGKVCERDISDYFSFFLSYFYLFI